MTRVMPAPALAATVRQLREARGIPREMVAFDAGITTGTLARIELCQAAPAWHIVRRIAQALNVSPRLGRPRRSCRLKPPNERWDDGYRSAIVVHGAWPMPWFLASFWLGRQQPMPKGSP